jgi:hypothetical protein
VASSELQAYYKYLRTVRENLINEQQQRSVQTRIITFKKQVKLLSLYLLINVCIVFFLDLNKGCTVIFLNI